MKKIVKCEFKNAEYIQNLSINKRQIKNGCMRYYFIFYLEV